MAVGVVNSDNDEKSESYHSTRWTFKLNRQFNWMKQRWANSLEGRSSIVEDFINSIWFFSCHFMIYSCTLFTFLPSPFVSRHNVARSASDEIKFIHREIFKLTWCGGGACENVAKEINCEARAFESGRILCWFVLFNFWLLPLLSSPIEFIEREIYSLRKI